MSRSMYQSTGLGRITQEYASDNESENANQLPEIEQQVHLTSEPNDNSLSFPVKDLRVGTLECECNDGIHITRTDIIFNIRVKPGRYMCSGMDVFQDAIKFRIVMTRVNHLKFHFCGQLCVFYMQLCGDKTGEKIRQSLGMGKVTPDQAKDQPRIYPFYDPNAALEFQRYIMVELDPTQLAQYQRTFKPFMKMVADKLFAESNQSRIFVRTDMSLSEAMRLKSNIIFNDVDSPCNSGTGSLHFNPEYQPPTAGRLSGGSVYFNPNFKPAPVQEPNSSKRMRTQPPNLPMTPRVVHHVTLPGRSNYTQASTSVSSPTYVYNSTSDLRQQTVTTRVTQPLIKVTSPANLQTVRIHKYCRNIDQSVAPIAVVTPLQVPARRIEVEMIDDEDEEEKPSPTKSGESIDKSTLWEMCPEDREILKNYYIEPGHRPFTSVCKPETKLFSYERAIIYAKDLAKLDIDQLLNDHNIYFAMLYIVKNLMHESLNGRTHFFDTFFFSQLNEPIGPTQLARKVDNTDDDKLLATVSTSNIKIQELEKRLLINYKRVKSWTRKVNIFEKDVILIPVHDELEQHWYTCIVIRPKPATDDYIPINTLSNAKRLASSKQLQIGITKGCEFRSGIAIADSLPSDYKRHNNVASIIRTYLGFEWVTKFPNKPAPDFLLHLPTIHLHTLPGQNNDFDCGVMMLQYIQNLLQMPLPDRMTLESFIACLTPKESVYEKRLEFISLYIKMAADISNLSIVRECGPLIAADSTVADINSATSAQQQTEEFEHVDVTLPDRENAQSYTNIEDCLNSSFHSNDSNEIGPKGFLSHPAPTLSHAQHHERMIITATTTASGSSRTRNEAPKLLYEDELK